MINTVLYTGSTLLIRRQLKTWLHRNRCLSDYNPVLKDQCKFQTRFTNHIKGTKWLFFNFSLFLYFLIVKVYVCQIKKKNKYQTGHLFVCYKRMLAHKQLIVCYAFHW